MFASAQVRRIALAVAVTSVLAAAPASARAEPHEPVGLPLTPPPLESSNPRYEGTPTAQPAPRSGSAGFGFVGVLVAPLGFALGGLSASSTPGNVAVPFTPTPRLHPLAPAPGERPAALE
jgi:hypothetical protein